MKRSAMAFARGAPGGVRMMRMSAPANTASNAAVNLASRSRIRNRNCSARSPRSEAAQKGGVDVREVDGDDRVGLRGQELAPGRAGASRSRIEAGLLEDRPDGGRGDRMADSDEFTLDAPVAP